MTLTELKALIDRTNDVMEPADVDLGDMSDQSRTYLEYLENEVCQYRAVLPKVIAMLEAAEGMEKVLSLLPAAETETWRDLVTLTKAQQALTEWKKIKTLCGK